MSFNFEPNTCKSSLCNQIKQILENKETTGAIKRPGNSPFQHVSHLVIATVPAGVLPFHVPSQSRVVIPQLRVCRDEAASITPATINNYPRCGGGGGGGIRPQISRKCVRKITRVNRCPSIGRGREDHYYCRDSFVTWIFTCSKKFDFEKKIDSSRHNFFESSFYTVKNLEI